MLQLGYSLVYSVREIFGFNYRWRSASFPTHGTFAVTRSLLKAHTYENEQGAILALTVLRSMGRILDDMGALRVMQSLDILFSTAIISCNKRENAVFFN